MSSVCWWCCGLVGLRYELALIWRQREQGLAALTFFVLMVILLPLVIGSHALALPTLGIAIIWVAMMFACVIDLKRIFYADFEHGHLEQLLLSEQPLGWLIFIKAIAHWIGFFAPILLTIPLLSWMMHLTWHTIAVLQLALLLATLVCYFLGIVMAALLVGLRQGGSLLTLLLLPLYVPILIFGNAMVVNALHAQPYDGQLLLLIAMAVLLLPCGTLLAAKALQVGMGASS